MAACALILVNFNTAAQTLAALTALRRQELPLELVVVDNASRPEEQAVLQTLPRDVRVVWNDKNVGYGEAINRAVGLTTAPVVGFLNPDTVPFPGALSRLVQALQADPRVGAVGPRAWWDRGRTFLLPTIQLPTLLDFLARKLATALPMFGLWYGGRLLRWVLRVASAEESKPVRMLSGAFLLTRRNTLEAVGGFDPTFQLYYEDADWCRRLRATGRTLRYIPSAEIVHHYDQSARQVSTQAEAWRAESITAYLRKHYGVAGLTLYRWAASVEARLTGHRPPRSPLRIEPLAPIGAPPAFELPSPDCLVQVSWHWLFLDAALARVAGSRLVFPEEIWDRLRPVRYFARALDPGTLRTLRVWTWEKVAA